MNAETPHTHLPQFKREARRQSLLVAKDAKDGAITKWLETVADTKDWGGQSGSGAASA
jgi:hypothetical protein